MANADEKWQSGWRANLKVLGIMAGVAVLASALMLWWATCRVEPRAASSGENRYAEVGSFGDSFAPVVGFLTSLALGAAIASVLMQREELQEARKQYKTQADALKEANDHARRANELALSGQFADLLRQTADLDTLAIARVQAIKDQNIGRAHSGSTVEPIGDPGAMWLEYARASENQRRANFRVIDNVEIQELAKRRAFLENTRAVLQGDQTWAAWNKAWNKG